MALEPKDFRIYSSADEAQISKVVELFRNEGIGCLALSEAIGRTRHVWIARKDSVRAKEIIESLTIKADGQHQPLSLSERLKKLFGKDEDK